VSSFGNPWSNEDRLCRGYEEKSLTVRSSKREYRNFEIRRSGEVGCADAETSET
jgi:hypothetical protein